MLDACKTPCDDNTLEELSALENNDPLVGVEALDNADTLLSDVGVLDNDGMLVDVGAIFKNTHDWPSTDIAYPSAQVKVVPLAQTPFCGQERQPTFPHVGL